MTCGNGLLMAAHAIPHVIFNCESHLQTRLGLRLAKKEQPGGWGEVPTFGPPSRWGSLSVDCTNSLGSVDTRWSIRVHHINSIRRRKNRFTTAERARMDIDFQSLSALPWSRSSSGSTPKRVPWPAGRYSECWALSRAQAYAFECRTSRASVFGQAALFAK